MADVFDPSVIAQSGLTGRIANLGTSISDLVSKINDKYAAIHGEDLFKATNKTAQALIKFGKPIKNIDEYGNFLDGLYFVFREEPGARLGSTWPVSFADANALRVDFRHDLDHGGSTKSKPKRRGAGTAFSKYAGIGTPETIDPSRFPLFQASILSAIEGELRAILLRTP